MSLGKIHSFLMVQLLITLCVTSEGMAKAETFETVLGAPFSDNMVLQQSSKVNIWGWDKPNVAINIKASFNAQANTTANESGYWSTSLQTPAAETLTKINSKEGFTLTITGSTQLKLENVVLGEVWLASGQSNMEWPLSKTNLHNKTIAEFDCANLRFLTIHRNPQQHLTTHLDPKINTQWQTCTPETLARFSAVAYYFGTMLKANLNLPIGIINASYGGTRINPWTPIDAFSDEEQQAVTLNHVDTEKRLSKQLAKVETTENQVNTILRRGYSYLYNGMIHPVVPYTLSGVIWYQGESDRGDGQHYGPKFVRMINAWRSKWSAQLPFYFVQLAPHAYSVKPSRNVASPVLLSVLRDAQAEALALPNTGMAVITDYGDAQDIHPREKRPVGERLALLALKHTYHQDILANSPQFSNLRIEGNNAIVSFKHAVALQSRNDKALNEFEIAGNDKVFYTAQASIVNNQVHLKSDNVKIPVAVRFAYHELANPNLVNEAGLPAVAFRTDEWIIANLPKSAN